MESIAFTQNAVTTVPTLAAVNVPAKVIEFTYDGLSRRIRKKVTEGASTIAVWEAYIYDGWNMVLSVKLNPAAGTTQGKPLGGASAQATRYVWGPDIGSKPFARRDWQAAGGVRGLLYAKYLTGPNAGKVHIPVTDAMGNVTSVHLIYTNGSASYTQRADFVYDYDAFGKETRSSALVAGLNPDSFPFHYSTKFTDGETGLNYYGYRFYDPANGRWINRDPIGERGGKNLYGMCYNDTPTWFDDTGAEPEKPTGQGKDYDNHINDNVVKDPATGKDLNFDGQTADGKPKKRTADNTTDDGTTGIENKFCKDWNASIYNPKSNVPKNISEPEVKDTIQQLKDYCACPKFKKVVVYSNCQELLDYYKSQVKETCGAKIEFKLAPAPKAPPATTPPAPKAPPSTAKP
jgi:RHS repeat-associated protein